jgi:competence protein ComFC
MNSLLHSVRDFLNAGLSFVYPEVCQICGEARAAPEESFLCADCRASARFIQPPFCERCGLPFEGAITNSFECSNCRGREWFFSQARSAIVARDQMLEVIHRYKYQRALWFEPFLADLLIRRALPELGKSKWTRIVPVPLHPTKQREREFNQAERLGRRLSASTGIPLDAGLLCRRVATRTQTLLSREERLTNVRNAFVARAGARLHGERIVLVDDVFTTGATTSACAKVLKAAGAGEVCVWTVGRGV